MKKSKVKLPKNTLAGYYFVAITPKNEFLGCVRVSEQIAEIEVDLIDLDALEIVDSNEYIETLKVFLLSEHPNALVVCFYVSSTGSYEEVDYSDLLANVT